MASYPDSQITQPAPLYIPNQPPPPDPRHYYGPDGNNPRNSSQLYHVPITPATRAPPEVIIDVPPESPTGTRSHFSPDTPNLEKGKGGIFRSGSSVSARFARSFGSRRSNREQLESIAEERRGRDWLIWGMIVVLILLIANIIYLDMRLMNSDFRTRARPKTTAAATNANSSPRVEAASAIATPTPSESTHGVVSTPQFAGGGTALAQAATLPSVTQDCIQQFPSNAAMDGPGFCSRCFEPLQDIPPNFFNTHEEQGDWLSQVVNAGIVFCEDTGFALT